MKLRCIFASLFFLLLLLQKPSEMPTTPMDGWKLCTGRERLTKYGQEGLVPFVGELNCRSSVKLRSTAVYVQKVFQLLATFFQFFDYTHLPTRTVQFTTHR